MQKQIKQRGYNHKSTLRPRPELNEIRKKEAELKSWVFENLDNASKKGSLIFKEKNDFIANNMKSCTGDFEEVNNLVICQFIMQWRYKNENNNGN